VVRGQAGEVQTACDWSPDGRFLLFRRLDSSSGYYDLYAVAADGGEPFAVVTTPYDDRDGQFSPDGKWIAYQSDEAGHAEIYVQPFRGTGSKQRVSITGGTQVRWRNDGRELFYVDTTNRLTAVPVSRTADGELTFGQPATLFETRLYGAVGVSRQQYVPTPDGQRFLIVSVDEATTATPLTLILNWTPHTQ
jgi:dipeptidyl aminopeptidase/acylaminoacyl peptidase